MGLHYKLLITYHPCIASMTQQNTFTRAEILAMAYMSSIVTGHVPQVCEYMPRPPPSCVLVQDCGVALIVRGVVVCYSQP